MATFSRRMRDALMFGAWVGGAAGAVAAGTATEADAALQAHVQARYAQERARCLAGSSPQDQATCLREAGAARDAALKRKLDDGGAAYDQNAKERCAALSGDEALDCLARTKGRARSAAATRAVACCAKP